jgi:hypothetical protein
MKVCVEVWVAALVGNGAERGQPLEWLRTEGLGKDVATSPDSKTRCIAVPLCVFNRPVP